MTVISKPTILVVEDDPVVRNTIVDVLSRQGWLVFEADTAAEAQTVCKALQDEQLDLLIVADELNDSKGSDLANRIRAGCPKAQILHLSLKPSLVRVNGFLQKPFTTGQLVNAVENLLNPRTH